MFFAFSKFFLRPNIQIYIKKTIDSSLDRKAYLMQIFLDAIEVNVRILSDS